MKKLLMLTLILSLCLTSALAQSAGEQLTSLYQEAELLMVQGNYAAAATKFESLGAYADASQMAMYCKAIDAAETLGVYGVAVEALNTLGDFKDSRQLAAYYVARDYEAEGDLWETDPEDLDLLYACEDAYAAAVKAYEDLFLYKDCLNRRQSCQAQLTKLQAHRRETLQKRMQNQYAAAVSLQESGQYAEAIRHFNAILSYQDSRQRVNDCRNALAYEEAKALEAQGMYSAAMAEYKRLGDYQDCPARIAACMDGLYAAAYADALALEQAGHYQEARDAYKKISVDYKDAAHRAQSCHTAWLEVTYQEALTLEAQEQYAQAADLYHRLADYEDAKARTLACQNLAVKESAYQAASEAEAAGDLAIAIAAFESIPDYKDSALRAQAAAKKQKLLEIEQLITAEKYSQVKTKLKDDPQTRAELEARYPKLRFRLADNVRAFDKDGYAFFQENRKWGIIDWQGNVIHEPQWDSFASGSRKGENGLYGYISSRGDLLLPYEYTRISLFKEGYFVAEKNGAAYVLDGEGAVISQLPSGKTYQYHVGEGLIRFKDKKGKLGLTDLKGKIKVKAKYDYIGDFEYGMAEVYVKDKKGNFQRGLINLKGKEIVKPGKYEAISILGEDLLAVLKKNSIERHLVTPKGKSAGSLGNLKTLGTPTYGLLPICDELGFWGALRLDDLKGKQPLSTMYKEMTITARGTLAAVKENWWHLVKTDGSNDIITTHNYDEMSAGADSLYFAAKRGGGWYILDASGKEIY